MLDLGGLGRLLPTTRDDNSIFCLLSICYVPGFLPRNLHVLSPLIAPWEPQPPHVAGPGWGWGGRVVCVPEVAEVINGEASTGPNSDVLTLALNPQTEGRIKLIFN